MKHASINKNNMLDVKPLIAAESVKFKLCLEQELTPNLVGNNPYQFLGFAKLDATAVYLENAVQIDGEIVVPMQFLCSRCGALFKQNLFIEVSEKVLDNANDGEHFNFSGDEVDVGKIINEIVASNIPSVALCREDCKGICPVCGKNKNEENCSCEQNLKAFSPFSCLKDKIN